MARLALSEVRLRKNRIRALREVIAQREHSVAPAAAATAEAEPEPDPLREPAEPTEPRDDGSVLTSWWFWTIAGVLVLGAVVTGIALAASPGDTVQAPMPGDFGVVVIALGGT